MSNNLNPAQFFKDHPDPFVRAAASMAGKPGAIDPIDAELIGRAFRARDRLQDAGYRIASHSDKAKYPRGVSIHTSNGRMADVLPKESGGWRVHEYDPEDHWAEHTYHEVNEPDENISRALENWK